MLPRELPAGRYRLKEIQAAPGYVLDDTVRTIELKSGETTGNPVNRLPGFRVHLADPQGR